MATLPSGDEFSQSYVSPEMQKYRLRACQSCARSKLKCEWPSELASSCHRCAKMETPCVPAQVNTRKRRGPSKRIGKLEEKLDGILSILNTGPRNPNDQMQHGNSNSQIPPPETQIQTQSRTSWLPNPTHPPTLSSVARSTATDSPTPSRLKQTTTSEYIDIVPGFRMTSTEADTYLNEYRSAFTPYFPFVPVPITMSAYELYEEAPFLLRTILTVVAAQTLEVQRSVQRWFRQYLAEHLVVEQERRLELLQAILIFVAWGNFQFYIESQATDLLQLAGTLVVDLGLDKSPDALDGARLSFIPDAIRKVKGLRKEGHTLDDMRAMLGFAYLDSVVTTLYRRTRSFVFTPYLTNCCDTVLAAQEHDSDKFAVAIIYMQRLLTRVSDAIPHPDQDENASQFMTTPLYMIMATSRKALDQLVGSQPPEVQSNVLLWTNYHGVLMRLYETAIHMRPSSSFHDLQESTHRTEVLSSCLQAAKDFFAAYASIPLDILGAMPLVATAYLAFAMVTSSRLLLLDDSDWEVSLTRLNFDFAMTCKNLGDRFEQADRLALSLVGRRRRFDNGVDASILTAYSVKIRWIREWYLAKVATGIRPEVAKQSSSFPVGSAAAQEMELDDSSFLPVELDEGFWSALLASNGPGNWGSLQDYNT